MKNIPLLIIGGGPAGLSAALVAANAGIKTIIIDDGIYPGGQLTKQTHKFFGSKMERAGTRGFVIGEQIVAELKANSNVEFIMNTTVSGIYPDGVVSAIKDEKDWLKFKPAKILISTGASEKLIAFPGNDLPGVYGAGAVQTLMNLYGVIPGKRVLMIGAGNIGLIVSYQLMQAGVPVAAVVEAADRIGGYWVHASKIRRLGVPILTNHTIVRADGNEKVESAVVCAVDSNWNLVKGTEKTVEIDTICLAVGLSPAVDLLYQANVDIKYIAELGGEVPLRNEFLRTSNPDIYVAGDVAGIEEASSAMLGGQIAGYDIARSLGAEISDFEKKVNEVKTELKNLRSGPIPARMRAGLEKAMIA